MPRAVRHGAREQERAASTRAHRPLDLWGAGLVVLSLGGVAVAGLALIGEAADRVGWISRTTLAGALLGMALATATSVLLRTLQMRRMASRLEDERVLSAAYSNRVRDLSGLVAAAETINGVLELDQALRTLLDEALTFFETGSGSIMLVDEDGFLKTVCSQGNDRAAEARVKIGHSIAGHVALTREPLLLEGTPNPERFSNLVERDRPVAVAMSVPLIHRDEVLGVLNVSGEEERAFTDHDLQLASVFAGHVSVAVANARIFDSARDRLAQLAELNRTKSELISTISQDLRGPVAGLGDELATLRRFDHRDDGAREGLQRMARQVARLSNSVDRLLTEAAADGDRSSSGAAATDLRDLALTVARDFESGGRTVEVEAPSGCLVTGDPGLLQQVLWNLLQNAFQHGAPPVRIEVRADHDTGIVSVIDAGPGIAPSDRERIRRLAAGEGEGGRMGLGLSIAHAIVSGCGGRIWAKDADGGGAAFHIAIPLAEHAEDVDRLRGVSV